MKRMAIIYLAITLLLLNTLQLAYTETFKWVDERGTGHFTDDVSEIPEKYKPPATKNQEEAEREQKQRQEKADGWKLYKRTSKADHYYKVSERDKSVVHVKTKTILKDDEGYIISNEVIDCEKNMRRGSQYWKYDTKGKLIGKKDFSPNWYPLDNQTVLYDLKPLICSDITAIPSFRIAAKYRGLGITYAVLVSENTNREQLKDLILGFGKARKEGSFSKLIPPTTPGSKLGGDYNAVEIFVFSEPNWPTESKFKKWMESSLLRSEDKVFDKEYVKHIKAYYLYSFPSHEEGSIGYSGEGVKSPDYEKLF